jgi:protein-tyrosine phosphatase
MVKVLFVCLGNICRSPMAEGVFQYMVNQAGLSDKVIVDSAGTAGYHEGEQAHHGTLGIFKKYDIPYNGRARRLTRQDFETYDYILAMDEENLAHIRALQPKHTKPVIRLFLDYAEGIKTREVPDPYYNGKFDEVYDLVTNASAGLLKAVRETLRQQEEF